MASLTGRSPLATKLDERTERDLDAFAATLKTHAPAGAAGGDASAPAADAGGLGMEAGLDAYAAVLAPHAPEAPAPGRNAATAGRGGQPWSTQATSNHLAAAGECTTAGAAERAKGDEESAAHTLSKLAPGEGEAGTAFGMGCALVDIENEGASDYVEALVKAAVADAANMSK